MILIHPVVIKPYLRKYMSFYVPVDPEFTLSEKNRYGAFLICTLRHKKHILKEDLKGKKIEGEKLNVRIPDHYVQNNGLHIPHKAQLRFNTFLLDEFNDRMLHFVVPKLTGKKGDIRKALLQFRDFYNITEDELAYRTLEKQWLRHGEFLERFKAFKF